jgi:hypothetical protein
MFLVPNRDVIIPFGEDRFIRRAVNNLADMRGENRTIISCNNTTSVVLSFTPTCPDWVEIYKDGFRIMNSRVSSITGGTLYETFNVQGRTITFTQPMTGTIVVVCDTVARIQWNASIIQVDNVQGFKTARASLYIEPVIVTEPVNGYARLSTDRMSMVYLPKNGFVGDDSFSYCLINNHGQYSRNYCVNITVY